MQIGLQKNDISLELQYPPRTIGCWQGFKYVDRLDIFNTTICWFDLKNYILQIRCIFKFKFLDTYIAQLFPYR